MRGSISKHDRHETSLARRVHPTQLCGCVPNDKRGELIFRATLGGGGADFAIEIAPRA